MKKENVLFAVAGILLGFFGGFFLANTLNRREISGQNVAQTTANPPFLNQQTQAADIKPSAPPAKTQTGGSGGMLPDIADILDKAKNEPNNFDAQMRAGDMYARIQKFDEAAEFYEKAAQVKPGDLASSIKIGNFYYDTQKFERAEKFYLAALEKKSDDANVRTDLGITFIERAKPDFDRAVKEFQTALETNPKFEPALYNMAIAYYKRGDAEQAGVILNQLEEINPQSQLVVRLRDILSKK